MSPFEVHGKELVKSDVKPEATRYIGTDNKFKHEIVWKNAIGFLILHLLGLWGLYIVLSGGVQFRTIFWSSLVLLASLEGVTVGAHRLYSHRSFKASPLVRAVLIIFQSIAGQNSMFTWCRDHRLHHRYSDTDADPHNAKRGFFFSHIGWLMTKKHPLVIELGKKIDLSDLKADWMVMFQKKYYYVLYVIFAITIPVAVPVYFFSEPLLETFLVVYVTRYVYTLNGTWLVNSAAHRWGMRPYDKNIMPVESRFVSAVTQGEGWHNYHHAYPWDYKAAELTVLFNSSAKVIEFLEKIGLASDLKKASDEVVQNRVKRTGDGSHWTLGSEVAQSAVTALGPLHPFNPSYTTTLPEPDTTLRIHEQTAYNNIEDLRTEVGLDS